METTLKTSITLVFIGIYIFGISALCSFNSDKTQEKTGKIDTSFLAKPFLSGIVGKNKITLFDNGKIDPLLIAENKSAFISAYSSKTKVWSFPDTVINDERGRYIGTRLKIYNSAFRWLDDDMLIEMQVNDPEIAMNNGFKCGLRENELYTLLFKKPFPVKPEIDTVRIDMEYAGNFIDIILKDKKVCRINQRHYPN